MQARVITSTIEDLSAVSGTTSLTGQIVNGINSGNQSFSLVNQDAQVVATVSNLIPILAPFRIQTNTAAAATVFLKMELDVQAGKGLDPGDVLSLVGDVAGVVATVALFAAAPEVAVAATAVAVAADLTGIFTSAAQQALAGFTNQFASENLTSTPTVPTNGSWYLTSDGQLMMPDEIQASGRSYGAVGLNLDGTGATLMQASGPAGSTPAGDDNGTNGSGGDWGDGEGDESDDMGDTGDEGDGDDEAAHTLGG